MTTFTPIPDTQTAYDRMRAYFSHPEAIIARSDDQCKYRVKQDPDGPGCAIGCLIPNDMYNPEWEEIRSLQTILNIEGEFSTLGAFFCHVNLKFLTQAQDLHDRLSNDAAHFVRLLDELAFKLDLTVPEAA